MVHGLGSSGSFWENVLPELSRHFDVSTPDLPGHGPGAGRPTPAQAHPRELAARVIEALRSEGIEHPHLVGLSLGGWVVLEMAALGFGSSVVALAPAGLWVPGQKIASERSTALLRHGIPPIGPLLPRLTRMNQVKRMGLRSLVRDTTKVSSDQLLAAAIALGQARGYGVCDRAAVRAHFGAAGKVRVPTSVAFGDHDRVLPPVSSQNRSLLPEHARFTTVTDCGHAMSWDRPDACIELIVDTASPARLDRSAP